MIWDLDNEARETAEEVGLAFARAATAGTHPAFVATVRGLLEERRAGLGTRYAVLAGLARTGGVRPRALLSDRTPRTI